ncbi:MAG: PspC domain-containing protein [Flavobacteriales bacterium]|nr:PspC domain-containing protein [Flavobacteriales bacterium]
MDEKKILGVCSWLGNKFDINIGLVRIVFLAAVVFGMGMPILAYFALAFYKSKIE